MPVYVFRCRTCGNEFEELVMRMGQSAPCPKCGAEDVEQKISAPAVGHQDQGSSSCGVNPSDCGFS